MMEKKKSIFQIAANKRCFSAPVPEGRGNVACLQNDKQKMYNEVKVKGKSHCTSFTTTPAGFFRRGDLLA